MGTNYYLTTPKCDKCGHQEEGKHIGKSSFGWCFSLRVYPEEANEHGNGAILDLDGWKTAWSDPKFVIVDEYGTEIHPDDMLTYITNRSWHASNVKDELWYEQNHACPGPNGLVRHKVDGRFCIGHGDGTWDYIVGEFS